jgi:uracil-DNA glycosylase family 4
VRLIQSGPRDARVVIVGEAPGGQEMAAGKPFVGGSGELLNKMLDNANKGVPYDQQLRREHCFITNICHIQPLSNNFAWFMKKENQPILLHGIVQLKKDLAELKPNLVIAFGDQPLQVLTGKQGISKYRGSILPSSLVPGLKIIATYHPAFCLRMYDYKAVVEMDLKRCIGDSWFRDLKHPSRKFYLDPSGLERSTLIEEMYNAPELAVDIECVEQSDGTWRLTCVGFSDRADRALVICVRGPEDRADIARLCGSPGRKILQNGTFDQTVLRGNGIELTGFYWDTMLAQHSLYPECAGASDETSTLTESKKRQSAIGKGLGFLVSINTREPYYKDDGKVAASVGDLQEYMLYNAKDAACTREIRDVQQLDLDKYGTTCVMEHEMDLVQPTIKMTARGILIDKKLRKSMSEELDGEINNLQAFLDGTLGHSVNPKSPKQVQHLLYEELKLPIKRNSDGNPTGNKDAIIELAEKYGHPILLTILAIRERRDILERYLQTPIDADGCMRCSWDITGTRTGRLSSRPSIFGSGQNLQNQPVKVRRCFVARPGKIFIGRDYKQAEAWVVAYEAEEEALIELLNDPKRDIHKENANLVYACGVDNVTGEQRYLAKKTTHSANYGVGVDKTVKIIAQEAKGSWGRSGTGITATHSQVKRILDTYFLRYPNIKGVYWREIREELRRSRTLTNCFGRKRTFFGRWESEDDSKFLNAAYSYKPQGAVGDLCCKALVECDREIPEADMLLNVHDFLMMETDVANVEVVAEKMAQCMAIPMTIKGRTFTIPSDCKVGYNWGDYDAKENPKGMRKLEDWLSAQTVEAGAGSTAFAS